MLERHKQIPEAEKQLVTQKQSFYRVARKAASSIILPHILFVTKLKQINKYILVAQLTNLFKTR